MRAFLTLLQVQDNETKTERRIRMKKSKLVVALIIPVVTIYLFGSKSYAASILAWPFAAPVVYDAPVALPSPSLGDIVYDTNVNAFQGYRNTGWANLAAGTNVAPVVHPYGAGSGTYTTPTSPAPLYIEVIAVGAGGGGAGSGTGISWGSGGTSANATTFGSSLITANQGSGSNSLNAAAGGTATVSSPAVKVIAVAGGMGGSGCPLGGSAGGSGGNNPLGGAGSGGNGAGAPGSDGAVSTGGGGGAGGSGGSFGPNGGGGAGGYAKAIINNPSGSYSYVVGAGGGAGTAGTSGFAGGAGGDGYIVVTEYYQ